MIARYVLKSFTRHKARTVIMVLALLVVTTMLVSLNNGVESLQRQIVEIVEREAGEHDITITRAETSGQVTMLEGEYNLEGDHVVVLRVTADTFGLEIGDEIDLSYIVPLSRMKGYDLPEDASVGRVTRRFTVTGIALATGLGGGGQNGILASVETVQDWLDVPGRAERLVVVLDEAVYGSLNTQSSIFRVRRIAERMYDALGSEVETYVFSLDKAQSLDWSDVAFAVLRSLSAVYGFLVMGVVGLLIYSIINSNVEERQRDLAFLRVLGAKRRHLFGLVMIEVALIGLIGVGLGIVAGQAFSIWVVAPVANYLITHTASDAGLELGIEFQMMITVAAMVRAAVIAAIVLFLSAIAPARKAASTKVRHAINPGSADSLQIEDLARLRSRKFDVRIIIAGIVLTIMWLLIFIGNNFLFVQGNEAVVSVFGFSGMALLVIGVSLLFYALTIPFERIMILLSGFVAPRLSFFAGPNLVRAKQRNTVISLMVVFSATLPTFLGTMTALEQKNYDVEARFRYGAPVTAQVSRWGWHFFVQNTEGHLLPSFLTEFRAVPGIARAVGLTTEFSAEASNRVALRDAAVQVQGLTGTLDGIVYGHYHPGSRVRRIYGPARGRCGARTRRGQRPRGQYAHRRPDRTHAGFRGLFAQRELRPLGPLAGIRLVGHLHPPDHRPHRRGRLHARLLHARRAGAAHHHPHYGDGGEWSGRGRRHQRPARTLFRAN
jgi:hypothetical protein